VSDVLSASHAVVQDALSHGQEVQFPGFGTFYTKQRPEARIRSIKDAQPIQVPARRVAAFRVGDVLKRAVRKKKQRKLFGV
jgi:DNA-binding protein HU-beta